MPVFLRPTAPIAPDALLPADPGQALLLAQELLTSPLMSNHHHGLWGYHGETVAGRRLTVQSTGIGGPSAAAVLHELHELGVRRALRIGSCAALDGRVAEGDAVVVERAIAADDARGELGAEGGAVPDRALADRLAAAAGPAARTGAVASTNLFYGPGRGGDGAPDALASDLESAALLAVAHRLGVAAAALLVVGHSPSEKRVAELGRAAAEALAAA